MYMFVEEDITHFVGDTCLGGHRLEGSMLKNLAHSENPVLILRELNMGFDDGRQWALFAGDVVIAWVPDYKTFINGWMTTNPRRIQIEPLEESV